MKHGKEMGKWERRDFRLAQSDVKRSEEEVRETNEGKKLKHEEGGMEKTDV